MISKAGLSKRQSFTKLEDTPIFEMPMQQKKDTRSNPMNLAKHRWKLPILVTHQKYSPAGQHILGLPVLGRLGYILATPSQVL